mmetsp:Transcript_4912/g.4687  ORF Transcript_4912/g.4687 Transcript_4912/m.4687 type:complete len:200 (+) Transcript_4912:239-838(+)
MALGLDILLISFHLFEKTVNFYITSVFFLFLVVVDFASSFGGLLFHSFGLKLFIFSDFVNFLVNFYLSFNRIKVVFLICYITLCLKFIIMLYCSLIFTPCSLLNRFFIYTSSNPTNSKLNIKKLECFIPKLSFLIGHFLPLVHYFFLLSHIPQPLFFKVFFYVDIYFLLKDFISSHSFLMDFFVLLASMFYFLLDSICS